MKPLLAQLVDGQPLSEEQAVEAFDQIMSGKAEPTQTAALLALIASRGATVDELVGAATVMRGKCHAVKAPPGAIDIVGTGGDGKGTLNISTAAAFVAAGAKWGQADGQIIFLLILAVAAAEVSVGLGLVLQIQRRFKSLDMDVANRLRG